jgi:hypothetical protein
VKNVTALTETRTERTFQRFTDPSSTSLLKTVHLSATLHNKPTMTIIHSDQNPHFTRLANFFTFSQRKSHIFEQHYTKKQKDNKKPNKIPQCLSQKKTHFPKLLSTPKSTFFFRNFTLNQTPPKTHEI